MKTQHIDRNNLLKEDMKVGNKKLNSTKEISVSTIAEDYVELSEKTDSLFDKVLIQVKEKNKGNSLFLFRQTKKK